MRALLPVGRLAAVFAAIVVAFIAASFGVVVVLLRPLHKPNLRQEAEPQYAPFISVFRKRSSPISASA